jgi:hypothetical protein
VTADGAGVGAGGGAGAADGRGGAARFGAGAGAGAVAAGAGTGVAGVTRFGARVAGAGAGTGTALGPRRITRPGRGAMLTARGGNGEPKTQLPARAPAPGATGTGRPPRSTRGSGAAVRGSRLGGTTTATGRDAAHGGHTPGKDGDTVTAVAGVLGHGTRAGRLTSETGWTCGVPSPPVHTT